MLYHWFHEMLSVSSVKSLEAFRNNYYYCTTCWIEIFSHFVFVNLNLANFYVINWKSCVCRNSRLAGPSKAVSREHNLAAVLVCTVTVFLVCHSPRLVLNCTELFMIDRQVMASQDYNEKRYPAFSLVELLHCCVLIGREPFSVLKYFHALKGPIIE